jgi:hypothetical protein
MLVSWRKTAIARCQWLMPVILVDRRIDWARHHLSYCRMQWHIPVSPSYMGDKDQKDNGSRPAPAKKKKNKKTQKTKK